MNIVQLSSYTRTPLQPVPNIYNTVSSIHPFDLIVNHLKDIVISYIYTLDNKQKDDE